MSCFPPEDSLDLLERRGRKRGAELEIAVLQAALAEQLLRP